MEAIKFYPYTTRCRHCRITTDDICEYCGGCQSTCCRCGHFIDDSEIKYVTRQVYYDTDDSVRRFRCYNIKHHVNNETADEIIQDKLGYDADQNDYCNELLDAVLAAQTQYLKRTIPEVHIEIRGTIDDEYIEDLLCKEISEATGWLHEEFEFEELK